MTETVPDNTVPARPKAGAYPNADRANLFGSLYIAFYEKWNLGGKRDDCWPAYKGLLNIARSKADKRFLADYATIAYHADGRLKPQLTLAEMDEIVAACWGLMDRIGTWDWLTDATEELVVP